jgi:hypothetical protein
MKVPKGNPGTFKEGNQKVSETPSKLLALNVGIMTQLINLHCYSRLIGPGRNDDG